MPELPMTVEDDDLIVEADVEVRGSVVASSLSAGRVTNDLLQAFGMGVLVLHDISGDEYRIWVDDSGNLRIKQGIPTYDGDGDAITIDADLAGKADVTGETFTGQVVVHSDADPTFLVEDSGGSASLYVNSNAVVMLHGANFAIYSDGFVTSKFFVVGATGEVEIKGPLNHDGTTVGFYGATPVTQGAANPDTSGATLAGLETEVNQLKATLRSLGLIAT